MRKPRVLAVKAKPSESTESPYPPDGDLSDYPPAKPVTTATKAVASRLGRALKGGN